jgi:type I restriction enzyme S subunit
MGLSKYQIGELVEQTSETNADLQFGADDVRGMTITKQIIPTKARMTETELSGFLVVKPDEFVYNPRTHGKKIGLGYNDTDESFIISWNNTAFRIKPEMQRIILAEYLYMHFNREEWDREACYRSWGSSTEVFSWNALCEMEFDLPPLSIQQKYVDVYNAMLQNQRAYESGLEDLKLTCDAYIENLRREMPHTAIGEYLELCEEKNISMKYDLDSVKGVSIGKRFIETKADMGGVSLKPYLLVEPDAFSFVTVTSRNGEKISLAHNSSADTYICSSSYCVFRVSKKDKLIPSYLRIFFSRSEFDRYTRFHSWGSARETFGWEDMCNVKIPIPDIEVQKSIVNIYNAYIARREINEKMKAQIKSICPILIKGSLEEAEI